MSGIRLVHLLKKIRQLADIAYDIICLRRKLLGRHEAALDTNGDHTGGARGMQIVQRVADHRRLARLEAELIQKGADLSGLGLAAMT